MVRDDDFIRDLLLEAESSSDPYILAPLYGGAAQEDTIRHVHAELLCDAGYFDSRNDGVYRITNQGHDYLAAIKNDTIWNKTKEGAASVGGVTLGVMKDMAVAYLKRELAEKTGLSL